MEQFFESQKEHIFKNVEVLIYVFDVQSQHFHSHDMDQFENCLKSLVDLSPKTRIFVLIHKMDLVQEDQRAEIF